ncbi:MAG: LuxR family transcriptional regulator [Jatrophihabitans sp.]|nr:MAG: LuxR family transcriptional regulator [Jatrophihabitans sp.]
MTMGDVAELSDLQVALYRAALRAPGSKLADLAAAVGAAPADVGEPLAGLSELGLVHQDSDTTWVAVSPMLAEASVLGAEDLDLGARRLAIETKRDTIRRLVPDWNEALASSDADLAVDVVRDQAKIGRVLMYHAGNCREELLSVAPGRLPRTRIDGRTRVANLYSLRRGIRTRALYQHAAMRDKHTRAYLTELADNGARIRLAPSLPGRSLVIDRDIALLPIPAGSVQGDGLTVVYSDGLAVVREHNVVAWVISTFEQLWAEAIPFEEVLSSAVDLAELDQTRAAILRLMAEGEKDEAISRRLSISVRTCRRHIADYMLQVGATSRFQAGVIAARAGHFDAGT